MLGFCLTWHRNGSRDNAKRRGESGHPCLVPFVNGNESEVTQLALTLAVGVVYATKTQLSILLPRPTYRNVANMKAQLTQSNAFSASVPIKTLVIFVRVAEYSRFRTYVVLSLASLVGTKPT